MTTTLPGRLAEWPSHASWPVDARSGEVAELVELAELDAIISSRAVFPRFQPIVDLATGEPVAFEALARGPEGSALAGPDALFGAARAAGRLGELDRLCRLRALESVVAAGLRGPQVLFLNREPATITADAPSAQQLVTLRQRGIRVVAELTERALSHDPARLLAFADRARAAGLGIALDDVGADADSLALMPFLRPDVIKLDLSLVQRQPDVAAARIVAAVSAYAEHSGAAVLAEGIETAEHERMAIGVGASLGQGWRYGRPVPLESAPTTTAPSPPAPQRPLLLRRPPEPSDGPSGGPSGGGSPFDTVTGRCPARRGSVELVFELRGVLEEQTQAMHGLAVVLLSCVDAPNISRECAQHYSALAASSRFVAALGAGMPDELVPGLRGCRLAPDDPVSAEWNLVVVGPHFAAALVARERFDTHPEVGRTFDYALTHDRALVLEVAGFLMNRALPLPTPDPTPTPAPRPATVDAGRAEIGLHDHCVALLAGTDAGTLGVAHGASLHQ